MAVGLGHAQCSITGWSLGHMSSRCRKVWMRRRATVPCTVAGMGGGVWEVGWGGRQAVTGHRPGDMAPERRVHWKDNRGADIPR